MYQHPLGDSNYPMNHAVPNKIVGFIWGIAGP